MRLLEKYIKSVLLEKGRFRSGEELDCWLIGLNCSREKFVEIFNQLEENQVTDRSAPNAYMFDKNEATIKHIENILGVDDVDRVLPRGIEFKDNLPVFVLRNVGDLNSDPIGKAKIIDCFDWIVHDMWHELVDDVDWYRHIFPDGYSMNMEDDLEKYFYKKPEIEADCLKFLKHYNFTIGVGEEDALASMAAFIIMRRDVSNVDAITFSNKMNNFKEFKKFYKKLYRDGPLIWNKIFKIFEGKIVCLCQ
jgi:hypothetical protein